jgi:hypothetical protein
VPGRAAVEAQAWHGRGADRQTAPSWSLCSIARVCSIVCSRTAEELGMTRDGTARVEVAPVEVPQRDGARQAGAGAGPGRGGDSAAQGSR